MKERFPLRQIKASAGSGKTYTLTGEILALLRGAESQGLSGCVASHSKHLAWPEVLGVTFTNRAATEMKDRVLLNLKKMALEEEPPHKGWTASRAAFVLESLVRQAGALNIRTIDSLIHLIVRLSALDLDLPPDFEAVFSDAELLAPLLDEMGERAREGDDELREEYALACTRVLRTGKFKGFLAGGRLREGVSEIASLFLAHKEYENISFSSVDEIRDILHAMQERFRNLAAELHTALEEYETHSLFSKALAKCIDPTLSHFDLPTESAYFSKNDLNECLIKAKSKSKKGKGEAEDYVCALYHRVCGAAQDLETSGKLLAGALGLMPYVHLARKALGELAWFQHGSRQIPASSVPGLADRVLCGTYGVSEAFCRMGNRLTHILVDEFQDTSRSQWEALKPLAVEALSRGGSLTVVGDVKQAIYGWRGGDADLFDEVPADDELVAMVPTPSLERLEANWRSRTEIIAWNNAVFSRLEKVETARQIMETLMRGEGGDALLTHAAEHLAYVFQDNSQNDARHKSGGRVRLTVLPPMSSADISDWLEEALPRRVMELRAQGRNWSELCILTQTNRQTSAAARWLLDVGVPVVTEGSLLLGEQPLVSQTASLLAFLDSPDDDRAFLAVLLGRELLPGAALGETRLHNWLVERLAPNNGKIYSRGLAYAFQRDFPEEWEAVFASLADGAGLLTPYDTVQELYQRWQVWERHPESRGFLLRFLEVVHLAEQKGYLDLASFLRYWRERGGEEKAPLPENMDAVRIMTIHKSKGLEAEVVLVPWGDFSLRDRHETMLMQVKGLTVLAPLSKAVGEPFYQARADNAQEAMHLLYVAWTRAVAELHLFLPQPENDPMSQAIHELIGPFLEHKEKAGAEDTETFCMKELARGEWVWGTPLADYATDSPAGNIPAEAWEYCEQEEPEAQYEPGMPDMPDGPDLEDMADGQGEYFGQSEPESSDDMLFPHSLEEDDWRPMHWLPRLKIFRSPLENWTLSPRRRGILLHRCLEFLRIGTDPAADAARAVRRGLMGLPVFEREELEKEFSEALAWYASLPETRVWMNLGSPEHGLLDASGGLRRVDLLVQLKAPVKGDNGSYLAVEYKTGASGELPHKSHVEQLETYLELLRASVGGKAGGALVYLDRRQIFRLGDDI